MPKMKTTDFEHQYARKIVAFNLNKLLDMYNIPENQREKYLQEKVGICQAMAGGLLKGRKLCSLPMLLRIAWKLNNINPQLLLNESLTSYPKIFEEKGWK